MPTYIERETLYAYHCGCGEATLTNAKPKMRKRYCAYCGEKTQLGTDHSGEYTVKKKPAFDLGLS